MPLLVSPARYESAPDFPTFLASVQKNVELWNGVYRTSVVPDDLIARALRLPGRWHLLALNEDWCGDGVHVLPLLARLVEQIPSLDLRILGRDLNPDLMDAHLWQGTRSIPVIIVLDEQFHERGWWGPRPGALQAWVRSEGLRLEKGERYRYIRQWIARDRGRSTIEEVLGILERAIGPLPVNGQTSTGEVASH